MVGISQKKKTWALAMTCKAMFLQELVHFFSERLLRVNPQPIPLCGIRRAEKVGVRITIPIIHGGDFSQKKKTWALAMTCEAMFLQELVRFLTDVFFDIKVGVRATVTCFTFL